MSKLRWLWIYWMTCGWCFGDGEVFEGIWPRPNMADPGDYEEVWVDCPKCSGRGWRWREVVYLPNRAQRRLRYWWHMRHPDPDDIPF